MEIFLFRSSSSPSLNMLDNGSIPADSDVCWDKPWQSEGDVDDGYNLYRGRVQRNSLHQSGSSVKRALSFSSIFTGGGGGVGDTRAGCNNGSNGGFHVKFGKAKKRFVAVRGRSKIMAGEYDSDATTTNDGSYGDASELYKEQSSDEGENINSSSHSDFADVYPNEEEREDDEELRLKLKEAEQRFNLISEFDVESETTRPRLLQLIKDINEDRMKMALEALNQVKDRISERSCARETLKKVKMDFATRLRRQVDERNRLQSSLNCEVDRRSDEQSSKLVRLEAEESRLRKRVRKFAEHNVSLQKEVSLISAREEETHMRITNLGVHLNGLTACLEEMKTENQNLHKTLSEVQKRSDAVELDRDRMARMCRENENEKKELQATVVKFQIMCGEHEKTIAGLRQACRDADVASDRDDLLNRLRVEHIRLIGVEQTLRKEVESYRHKAETLGQENISLMHRLQQTGGGGRSWFTLERELRSRMELLQSKGLEMMFANNDVCVEILDIVKIQQESNGVDAEFNGYYVVEYIAKCQSLRRGIEKFRTSLQTLSAVLKEKSNIEDEDKTGSGSRTSDYNHTTQINVELELKAESLVTKILREKLCSKELEFEQLQEEFASSITGHEKIKAEIKRLQSQLCNLQRRSKDMEVQISRKDADLNETRSDLEERRKELVVNRDGLVKVTKDRDLLREELNKLKGTNMVLSCEISSLRKKIESLEEDVLTKDGQISILKDSTLYSKSSSAVISKFKHRMI